MMPLLTKRLPPSRRNSMKQSKFKGEVEKLQETYQTLMKEKEDTEAAVKASGLGLMKSVKVTKAKAAAGSDEL